MGPFARSGPGGGPGSGRGRRRSGRSRRRCTPTTPRVSASNGPRRSARREVARARSAPSRGRGRPGRATPCSAAARAAAARGGGVTSSTRITSAGWLSTVAASVPKSTGSSTWRNPGTTNETRRSSVTTRRPGAGGGPGERVEDLGPRPRRRGRPRRRARPGSSGARTSPTSSTSSRWTASDAPSVWSVGASAATGWKRTVTASPAQRREEEELELDVAPVEPRPDTSQSRRGLAPEPRQHAEPERDRREQLAVEPGAVEEPAIDPDADEDAVRCRLEVQLARPVPDGPEEEREHLADAGEVHDLPGAARSHPPAAGLPGPFESGKARSRKWSTASRAASATVTREPLRASSSIAAWRFVGSATSTVISSATRRIGTASCRRSTASGRDRATSRSTTSSDSSTKGMWRASESAQLSCSWVMRAHRQEHLAQAAPARAVARQRLVELLSRDELALEQHVAQTLARAHTRDLRTISWASSPRRKGENGFVTCADAPMPLLSWPVGGVRAAREHDDRDHRPSQAARAGGRPRCSRPSLGIITSATMSCGRCSRGEVEELEPVPGREGFEAHLREDLADQPAHLDLVVGDDRQGARRGMIARGAQLAVRHDQSSVTPEAPGVARRCGRATGAPRHPDGASGTSRLRTPAARRRCKACARAHADGRPARSEETLSRPPLSPKAWSAGGGLWAGAGDRRRLVVRSECSNAEPRVQAIVTPERRSGREEPYARARRIGQVS